MTFKEKMMQEHPEYSNQFDSVVMHMCPSSEPFKYESEPPKDYCCDCVNPAYCEECWDREIPEEKLADEPRPCKTDPNVLHKSGSEPFGIKDSGARRKFETGAVRDIQEGKGRMDLLPWAAIMEVSKHCENGAKKYGEHNIDKGIPTHSLCDSAARHLAKYLDGWEDEPHLLAAAWNLLWAIQMHVKNKEMIDTPWKNENTTNTIRE
jgi:hypothetical protein